jgi:alkaline phosphatase D
MPSRRHFLQRTSAFAAALAAPPLVAAESSRPIAAQGLQLGDPLGDRLMVWSRADRPARMLVEWSPDESFSSNVSRIVGPYALESSDFTGRQEIAGLAAGRDAFVRVSFQGLDNERSLSAPVVGRASMLSPLRRDAIRFVWSADTAGQGWGINPDFGGMKLYEQMRLRRPHFFIHSGDTIYADGPIKAETTAEGGAVWKNIVTPEVAKVAETLDEFRGRFRYNFLDDNVRRFNAEVPQIWQWDDHEVMNNWSDSKSVASDARYSEKNVPLLVARAARAFLDYAPMRPFDAGESQRVYRRFSYGPLLEVFVLDMRSYRGGNSYNRQERPGPDAAFLGPQQLDWLKRGLAQSKAVWKIVAADMPIGLAVRDGKDAQGRDMFEAVANGDGPPLGRELEFADLFSYLKRRRVRNVVWLTGDLHYAAAHYYDPKRAVFQDFDGFWEFIAGPLNAGNFGPNPLDNTFGPQTVFAKAPPPGQVNLSPLAGMQFFGEVNVDARGLAVDLRDLSGQSIYRKELAPARA